MTGGSGPPGPFRLTSEHVDGVALITAGGELDVATAARLVTAVQRALDETAGSRRPVVLGLTDVSFVDSSGVRALLEAQQAALDCGRSMALLRPSAPVTRLLDLVDLRRFQEIDAIEAAVDDGPPPPPAA